MAVGPVERVNGSAPRVDDIRTVADLARLLRQLRRRDARRRGGAELTYRQLATGTGWSIGVISAYFAGNVLPPTDRFDVLIRLLGASPAEQGLLATARDRVEEHRRAAPAETAPHPVAVPRQLPHTVASFVGRHQELAALSGLLDGRVPAVVTIDGAAAIGKTTLAVNWAHQAAERFPDGQLFVNLRGFGPGEKPLESAGVLRSFLTAFGLAPERIPDGADARAALFRSTLADRRVLVLLDNARDAEQVRPLLPGSPGCLTLVTSRDRLTGLVISEQARPMTLDLLSPAESRLLLAHRLGPDRVGAAADQLIVHCGRLPLALTIVAARAAQHPGVPLHVMVTELQRANRRLDPLGGPDSATDVRAVFSWSYRSLSPPAARLFRLLPQHPGSELTAASAASLTAEPPEAAGRHLAELARIHLLEESAPGRYTCHDLLREYAGELARDVDPEPERRAAAERVLDHFLHTAHQASRRWNPQRLIIALPPAAPGVTSETPADHERAASWFGLEHRVLLDAVDRAAGTGFEARAWQLAAIVGDFLCREGHWHDWISMSECALAAAHRLTDPTGLALMHRGLGMAYATISRFDDARAHLRAALAMFERLDDDGWHAATHDSLCQLGLRQGQHEDALRHAERALALRRSSGSVSGQARALNAVGWCHAQLGRYELCLEHCREALALLRTVDDPVCETETYDSLGFASHHLGQHTEAIGYYRQALDRYRRIGNRESEAETLVQLGHAYAAVDTAAARRAWAAASTILDTLTSPGVDRQRAALRPLLDNSPQTRGTPRGSRNSGGAYTRRH